MAIAPGHHGEQAAALGTDERDAAALFAHHGDEFLGGYVVGQDAWNVDRRVQLDQVVAECEGLGFLAGLDGGGDVVLAKLAFDFAGGYG